MIEINKGALLSGVLSGIIVGLLSWVFRLFSNTRPLIRISKEISHSSEDGNYRIKIRNNRFSNVFIVTANFIISYKPIDQKSIYKNDLNFGGKADPLLYGRFYSLKYSLFHSDKSTSKRRIRTYDTFVLDAKRIASATLKNKASESPKIIDLFEKKELTIYDFFEEDESAIITAVFEAKNYRTGVTRLFYQTFKKSCFQEGDFRKGRSLKIDPPNDENSKVADNG